MGKASTGSGPLSMEYKESVFIIDLRSVQNEASTVEYYESLAWKTPKTSPFINCTGMNFLLSCTMTRRQILFSYLIYIACKVCSIRVIYRQLRSIRRV